MRRTERLGTRASRVAGAVTGAPEFDVAIFALLLNFAWENLQAPRSPLGKPFSAPADRTLPAPA